MSGIPDRIGEVIAFRAWWIDQHYRRGPILQSLNNHAEWPRGDWMRATCNDQPVCRRRRDDDDDDSQPVPGVNCTCGIYAARDRSHLHNEWRYGQLDGKPVALGECALAGRIIPGTKAYRAERARVVRLWVPYTAWKLVQPLSDAYGIPVALTNPLAERDRQGA